MNLADITTKCFILALFIRDDGERLLLGDGFYDFKSNLQHFQANTIANDVVELQGNNGQLLAGQVMRSGAQKFEGYIGDATTNRQTIEQKRSDFMAFFRIKHFYQVIYILPDGTAIQRRRGYLTDAPVVPEIFQKFPEYHIALNFEDVNYYEYAEDAEGNEIYAHIAEIMLNSAKRGGLVWDEIGAVSDSAGYIWEEGGSAQNIVTVAGVDSAWPIWTVQGGAQNPTLTNITTGQTITWQGFVPEGQTLTINMAEMTADLAGANVFEYITGEWIRLAPGNNTLVYTAGNADKPSTLSWNGVLA